MKTLFLLRHAKSSWDDATLADRNRPLAPRGRKAAPKMGRAMAARGWVPERALVSPSTRTRDTWEFVAAALPGAPKPTICETLYPGTAQALLAELRRVPKETGSVLLLAHNPAIEELAAGLAGPKSPPTALMRLAEKFPTAALARLEFDGDWADLDFGAARLTDLLRPKDIA